MRHWHPYIGDVVEQIVADGHRRVVGIVLAPHYSAMSVGAYEKKLLEAAGGRLDAALVRSWGDHPKFLDAVAGPGVPNLPPVPPPGGGPLLFPPPRFPQRLLAAGGPYPHQPPAGAPALAPRGRLFWWGLG